MIKYWPSYIATYIAKNLKQLKNDALSVLLFEWNSKTKSLKVTIRTWAGDRHVKFILAVWLPLIRFRMKEWELKEYLPYLYYVYT